MLLCIDIGNTNTVLATFDGRRSWCTVWRIKTDARSTADELGLLYRGLLAGDAVEIDRRRRLLDGAGGAAVAAHMLRALLRRRARR